MKPIRLNLQPSRQLAGVLLAAVFLAIVTLVCLPLPGLAKVPGTAVLAMAGWRHLQKDALLKSSGAWRGLMLNSAGEWQAINASGQTFDIAILPWSVATSAAIILCFRIKGRRLPSSTVLMPDSIGADEHRHLRIWLRWAYRGAPEAEEEVA